MYMYSTSWYWKLTLKPKNYKKKYKIRKGYKNDILSYRYFNLQNFIVNGNIKTIFGVLLITKSLQQFAFSVSESQNTV